MIVGDCASPGSCVYLSWCSALAGHWHPGHLPDPVVSSAADVNAAPFISYQGQCVTAPAPNICTMDQDFREQGECWGCSPARVLEMAEQCPATSAEAGHCHQHDESLPSPLAVGKVAVAEAPWSFKKRGYSVINKVLKMSYERLNVLSHLLGPYVLWKHLSVLWLESSRERQRSCFKMSHWILNILGQKEAIWPLCCPLWSCVFMHR